NLFDTVKGELVFNAYVSADEALPAELREFKKILRTETEKQAQKSGGRLNINFLDPDADGGKVGAQIDKDYGFKPMANSLVSNERFHHSMTRAKRDKLVQIPMHHLSSASVERNLAAAVKRFATGFTKTVAWVGPTSINVHGMGSEAQQYNQLEQF